MLSEYHETHPTIHIMFQITIHCHGHTGKTPGNVHSQGTRLQLNRSMTSHMLYNVMSCEGAGPPEWERNIVGLNCKQAR